MPETNKNIPDFREIFYKTLEETPPFVRTLAKEYSFSEIGITQINKLIPTLIFTSMDLLTETESVDLSDLNLWLLNPYGTPNEPYPHLLMDDELKAFLKNYNKLPIHMFRGNIIQDDFGKIYLWPIRGTEKLVTDNLNAGINSKDDLFFQKRWVTLIEKYGIEKIISSREEGKVILERNLINLIDQKTEDEYLFSFARKYEMTYFQYLRFRCLVDSAKETLVSTNFEKVAKEIIEFDKF